MIRSVYLLRLVPLVLFLTHFIELAFFASHSFLGAIITHKMSFFEILHPRNEKNSNKLQNTRKMSFFSDLQNPRLTHGKCHSFQNVNLKLSPIYTDSNF